MMKIPSLEDRLGYWLRIVSQQDHAVLEKKLSGLGILSAEWLALRIVEDGAGVLSSQLAVQLGMTRGAISKMLDRLEGRELIEKSSNEKDLRVQPLMLTAKGKGLLAEISTIVDSHEAAFFGSISEMQRKVLFSVLQKLADLHSHAMTGGAGS